MKAVFIRELKGYFYTMTGWLFLSVFIALGSLILYLNNILPRSSDITQFLSMMSYVWMLLSPMLVMRLLAGERRAYNDRLLTGSPLSVSAIVLGKYLAACAVMGIAVVLSLLFSVLLSQYAKLAPLEVLTGYLGFLLQGCAFIALDLMVTSHLKQPASAVAVAFGVNLFFWLASLLSNSASVTGFLARAIAFVSLYDRFVPFLNAQLSPANMVFYLLFSLCMLVLTMSVLHFNRSRTT